MARNPLPRKNRRAVGPGTTGRPTAAQMRADIDKGATGDKKPGFDPSAAPMETDAEAAGEPIREDGIEAELRDRRRPGRTVRQGADADAMRRFDDADDGAGTLRWGRLLAAAAVVAIAVLAIVYLG